MNLGARSNDPKSYDKNQMLDDVILKKLDNSSIQNMILNDLSNAFNWIDQRGNTGDNIPNEALDNFHHAILNKKEHLAVKYAVEVLETQKHPTASDIVDSPCKQAIYNICGKRAYNYEI
jgi:DNA-binding MltR family transcriptional regulator